MDFKRCKGAHVTLCWLVLVACSLGAKAQETPASEQGAKWDFGIWISGATGEENTNSFSEAQVWSAGLMAGRKLTGELGSGWRRGTLEYGFNVIPVFSTISGHKLYGGGFDPIVLRWNSSAHAGRTSPYIELAGGGLFTNGNLPAGDTSGFNFTAKAGGGVHIYTDRQRSLDLGCQWLHISNANLGTRNPEFNGIQLSLGYHWYR